MTQIRTRTKAKEPRVKPLPEPEEGFEVFLDSSYYDLWALRPIGDRDWNTTLHFSKREQAIHASYTIAKWIDNKDKGLY